MDIARLVGGGLVVAVLGGCASMPGAGGPMGPTLVGSGRSTETERYAEVGLEFTSLGDFVAIASPSRWKSPVSTGGSLSWLNPVAWRDDPGRTGRILAGEAVLVGGVAAAASAGGGGSGGGSSSGGTTTSGGTGSVGPITSNPGTPPPPPLDW